MLFRSEPSGIGPEIALAAFDQLHGQIGNHPLKLVGDADVFAARKNALIATAAKVTVAEVEEVVKQGDFDPNNIHTPGIFVKRIVEVGTAKKRIEFRNTRPRSAA